MYNHPCFDEKASHLYARVHLPIAKDCNIQCNFCNRKYDCANENRPGVTSAMLAPEQSISYLERVIAKKPNISVAAIAGPGEAFATPELTLKALRLVRDKFPDLLLCVATNGLNILVYINELKKIGVSHVTVTVNAARPEIGAKIYSWVRYQKKIYRGIEAAGILLHLQREAIRELKRLGFVVKVNTIIIPGINDAHIIEVAKKVSKLGADLLNCIPLCPSQDTLFEGIGEPDTETVARIRKLAEPYIKQMSHCRRCRADAAGILKEEVTGEDISCLKECAQTTALWPVALDRGSQTTALWPVALDRGSQTTALWPDEKRACIAIASREGMLINQHLGEAAQFLVYSSSAGRFKFLETRKAPEAGGGVKRWIDLANILGDCHAILVSNAGDTPREILKIKGICVIETEGLIENILEEISKGVDISTLQKQAGCNLGCSGGGRGCG